MNAKHVVLVLLALLFLGSLPSQGQTSAEGSPTQTVEPLAACDLACVSAHAERAVQRCVPKIEEEAGADVEWLYRPIGGVFKQADVPATPTSTIARYRGDNVRVQLDNQSWIRIIYECGLDTATDQVVYVKLRPANPGRTNVKGETANNRNTKPNTQTGPHLNTQVQNVPSAASISPQAPSIDLKQIGEPGDVFVRQVQPSQRLAR